MFLRCEKIVSPACKAATKKVMRPAALSGLVRTVWMEGADKQNSRYWTIFVGVTVQ